MNNWKKRTSGWIFISHSSKDFEYVRKVRDYLEDSGFSTLMVYLKSLDDPTKENQMKQILKWEIEARNIFVLCESEDALKSPWVKWEIDHVESLTGKIVTKINIDKLKYKKCTELSKLDNLMNRATIYSIYSREDKSKVNRILDDLNSIGFRIFEDTASMKLGNDTSQKLNSSINAIAEQGVVLIFLSKNALNSEWFWKEKEIALDERVFILPIILDDVNLGNFSAFTNIQCLNLNNRRIDSKVISEIAVAIDRKKTSNN
ncbi:MAG: toll/interleukin-1 receptor domain-containing protein [Campylobacterales bacterium]|nr:toll/interleukin-1 receptor domain-containing protein [Campylobacterales bacterium]